MFARFGFKRKRERRGERRKEERGKRGSGNEGRERERAREREERGEDQMGGRAGGRRDGDLSAVLRFPPPSLICPLPPPPPEKESSPSLRWMGIASYPLPFAADTILAAFTASVEWGISTLQPEGTGPFFALTALPGRPRAVERSLRPEGWGVEITFLYT